MVDAGRWTTLPLGDRRRTLNEAGRVVRASVGADVDRERLAADLRAAIEGDVQFDAGARALYSTDASNYRQIPIGVVLPRTVEDVIRTVEIARRHDAPVLPRGGGTSLAGQACNTAVVIDFSRYLNRLKRLDPERRIAEVEPGCILDTLRDAAEAHHLTFGPDPATHTHNSLGGMIGNNSGGVHSVMAGLTVDNVEALDILTYDGERMTVGPTGERELADILAGEGRRADIYRRMKALADAHGDDIRRIFPEIPRRVSGYENLTWLLPENGFHVARALVGTEATCAIVLGATLRLVPSPPERVSVLLGFPDIFQAADAVPRVLQHGPLACEGLDRKLIDNMETKGLHTDKLHLLPDGDGWLLVEFGGETKREARRKADGLAKDLTAAGGVSCNLLPTSEAQAEARLVRESGLGATAYVPGQPETWEGWEDSAVPREALGDYLRAFRRLLDRYGYDTAMYGHFGDGLVHCRINFDLASERGLTNWRRFLAEAADLVVSFGGSLSGEHGDGQARAALVERMYGRGMVRVFGAFREIWDPDGRMNPGKAIGAYPVASNLRVGPGYEPPVVKSHFAYPADKDSFVRATLRCVGVGKCRRPHTETGVMCPSYMATGEEKHSTRGRARLLFEMLNDGPITDGWRSAEVEEALDLCFACKGCKSDCPVSVDMATYKAEFRARHYAGRLRPRAAYSMGLIHWWARAGSLAPGVSNALLRAPGLGAAAKRLGGISADRRLPSFAGETFTRWFRRRPSPPAGGRRVVLWPDTFNDHFHPHILKAAVRALEALGCEVSIPSRRLCCGRPLYDWGMLNLAKRQLRQIVEALRDDIEQGAPVIGLEPACVSAFRDELPALLPDDPLARRLCDQTWFFSDFVDAQCDWPAGARAPGSAVVQLHCHQHAVIGGDAEWRLLDRLGVEVVDRPAGCCGMAGSLGFEAHKQAVSLAAAELALFPALRRNAGARVLANGFSCREQIRHGPGGEARHVAELVADAVSEG